jgi:hypothetical protein
MSANGRSLELYFVDGKPDGMLTAEVFNWTGHVLAAPRTQILEALSRDEAGRTGVYILLGERDGAPLAYIGEGEEVRERVRQHVKQKDWWNSAVLISSAADNLNKAHVKYLEARLIEIANSVGALLDNANTPTRPKLTEAGCANMEGFLENLFIVLPAVRVDLFLNKRRFAQASSLGSTAITPPTFEIVSSKHKLCATATLESGEFIVQKGSTVRNVWAGKTGNPSYQGLYDELHRTGALQANGDHSQFVDSYAFNSPSAAAAVIFGRASNGRTAWKVVGEKRTYADWENDSVILSEGDAA